ncbi:MAG TPA: UDP-N-acetylmuramate dehydrogenase, partial [Candidatus Latescibacteria bacterium]|nr:UDP-N-acetylmuramate dehydrogenase [Candidatus Latescibacterota bacterium]
GDSAGRLIDLAGCKGWHVGGVKVSEQHANFLVNSGEANTADTLRLIDKVRDRVLIEMGIELELEVRILSPEVA